MKKVIGMSLLLLLVTAVFISAPKEQVEDIDDSEPEEEVIEIVETEPIVYISDAELSKLYTCKVDKRKKDKSIVELSIDDAVLLMLVGRSEGGPTEEGQFWVMRTIYNRYLAGWGKTIWEILNQDNQFAVVETGKYKHADVNVESHLALAELESGYDPTEGALYWESNTNSPDSWHKKNLTFIKEVEGNLYYK